MNYKKKSKNTSHERNHIEEVLEYLQKKYQRFHKHRGEKDKLKSFSFLLSFLKKKYFRNQNLTQEKRPLKLVKNSSSTTQNNSQKIDKFIFVNLLIIFSGIIIFIIIFFIDKRNITSKQYSTNSQVIAQSNNTIFFSGKIVDKNGLPITQKTDISFRLYDSPERGNILYTGECFGENALTPNLDGIISVIIGEDCEMKKIPSSIFSNNFNLYLGITVGEDPEMTPRIQIPTSGYAQKSQTLEGIPLNLGSKEPPYVPFVNDKGEMLFSGNNIVIKAINENANFSMESNNTFILSSKGQSGINIQALGEGSIKFKTQSDSDTQTKLFISNKGLIGINTIFPLYTIDINGDARINSNLYVDGKISSTLGDIIIDSFSNKTIINDDLVINTQTIKTLFQKGILGVNSSGVITPLKGPAYNIPRWSNEGLLEPSIMYNTTSGIAIGTQNPAGYTLYVNGPAFSTGGWQTSDIRLKDIKSNLTNVLEKLQGIDVFKFQWKRDSHMNKNFADGVHIGISAQQVETYFPELINLDNEGFKAVDYSGLSAINTQAIKDLYSEVKALKKEIDQLEKDVQEKTDFIAGKEVIPAGKRRVKVKNKKISKNSLIFLTLTTKTQKQLMITEQNKGYFIVEVNKESEKPILFNWLIIR